MYRDRKGNYRKKPKNIFAKKRESAYGIFIQNSKVLLVKSNWIDVWEFPGGGKEPNESLFDALKREFLEETGFEVKEFKKNPIFVINTKFYADDLDEYFDSQMNFFIITKLGKQNKKLINNIEIVDLQNIPLFKLNKKNMNDIHLNVLNLIKNGRS